MITTYVIIGSSAAGIGAAATLARIAPYAHIVCISDEQEQPYNKCFLVDYVSGDRPHEQLFTLRAELAQHANFKLLLGTRVTAINSAQQSITLNTGQELSYTKLFMSMGGSPIRPPLPGVDKQGVFTFYTLADIETITSFVTARNAHKTVVIGAGLSGLECANALAQRGCTVTLIERGNRVLPHHTDERGSTYIEVAAQIAGVAVYTNSTVQHIVGDNGHVTGVCLSDGMLVPADLVIFTVGMRPNTELAEAAGVALQGRHVKVDNRLRTNVEHIFAGGDLVAAPSAVTGELVPSTTWPDAVLQGTIAAHAMSGSERTYPGVIGHTVSHFFDLDIASCGTLQSDSTRERIVVDRPGAYRVFELEHGVLKAFSLVGDTTHAVTVCRRALLTKQPIAKEELECL